MIEIHDHSTIGETFLRAAQTYANKPFLAAPAHAGRGYHPQGVEIGYAQAADTVRALMSVYAAAGYGEIGRAHV